MRGIVVRGSAVALGALAASAALALPLVQAPGSGAPEALLERPGGVPRVVVAHPLRTRLEPTGSLRRDALAGATSSGGDARAVVPKLARAAASVPRARPSVPPAVAVPVTAPVEPEVPAARALAQSPASVISTDAGTRRETKKAPAKPVAVPVPVLAGAQGVPRSGAHGKPERHEAKNEQAGGGGTHREKHKKD